MDELFGQSSLRILRSGAINLLSQQLNRKCLLLTEGGGGGGQAAAAHFRDYRGLAEFAQIDAQVINNRIENAHDHFREVLAVWCESSEVTVKTLLKGLAVLDRYDVIDDAHDLLVRDCEAAKLKGVTTQTVIGKNCLTLQVS